MKLVPGYKISSLGLKTTPGYETGTRVQTIKSWYKNYTHTNTKTHIRVCKNRPSETLSLRANFKTENKCVLFSFLFHYHSFR
jgi:hypothetical protein